MHKLPLTIWTPTSPLWIFGLVLAITFSVEGAIMLLLPFVPAWSRASLIQGLVDASILTLIMAPVLWLLVVKPLRQLSESRGQLLHSLFESQEQERSRIARDLHDEIGQQITALQVGLGSVESAKDLQSAQQLAHDLRKVGATAHEEVRRLARGLRPGVLEELGLAAAIERLCEDFENIYGVTVRLEAPAAAYCENSLPLETTLYRILQESLTNVARHAQASSVAVALTRTGDVITLCVEDNGHGIRDTARGSATPGRRGQGLDSIRERALMLQGDCTIRNAEGGGSLIQVTIPAPKKI
jgi:two-component system sensor histidine kinase NreB